ncbi:hypothetical protein V3C99_018743, partial [Haemonchus contortus]
MNAKRAKLLEFSRCVFVLSHRRAASSWAAARMRAREGRGRHSILQMISRSDANIQNEFGVCGWILTILSYLLIFVTLPISACMCIKVVQEYERAVIFRLGRLMPGGAKGPGIFFIVPCIDTYRKVDLRVLSFEVPPQEILSKDSVTVAVDAVVYFRISNATISVTNVEDAARSTKLLAQTTLRNILGTKTLAEMLSDREAISHQMQTTLDEATEPWGVKVERVEVKDVRLPVQLQRAMAAEAEAAREARAKVIVAEGEQKASRALKEAAEVIAESPSALQLRYLQTLNSISAEKNSTIIFPFPIDLLSAFLQRPAPKFEEPPPLPKKIRSCCLYKYPEWVQGMVGSEGKQQHQPQMYHSHQVGASGPSTTITSGRPPLPHSIREAQQHSAALHMQANSTPMQLDPGSLNDATRTRTWRDMRTQGSGVATNSLLKKAIANRLKPTVSGDKLRPPADRPQTNESGTSPVSENDFSAISDSSSNKVDTDTSKKTAAFTISNTDDNTEKAISKALEKAVAPNQPKKSVESPKDGKGIAQRTSLTDQGQIQQSGSPDLGKSSEQKLESADSSPDRKSGVTDKKIVTSGDTSRRSSPTIRSKANSSRQEKSGSPLHSPDPPAKQETSQSSRPETSHSSSVALDIVEHQKRPRHKSRSMASADNRRDSNISESSRISFASHKSVTFSDRVQLHEIERNEMSSSDEDVALMSDDELSKRPLSRHRRFTYTHQSEFESEPMSNPYSPHAVTMAEALLRPAVMPEDGIERNHFYAGEYPSAREVDSHEIERRGSDSSQLSIMDENRRFPLHRQERSAEMRSTGVQATELYDGPYPQFYPHMQAPLPVETRDLPRSASGYFEEEESDDDEEPHSFPHVVYPVEEMYSPGDSPLFFPGRELRGDTLMGLATYGNLPTAALKEDENELSQEPLEQIARMEMGVPQNMSEAPRGGSPEQTSLRAQHIMQHRASLPVQMMTGGRRDERSDIEEEMRRQFLVRFGAGRRAPVAEEDPCDPVHSMGSSDSETFSGSRESVVSAASIAKEAATHRNFN